MHFSVPISETPYITLTSAVTFQNGGFLLPSYSSFRPYLQCIPLSLSLLYLPTSGLTPAL